MSAGAEVSGNPELERVLLGLEGEFELMRIREFERRLSFECSLLSLELELAGQRRRSLPGGRMRWLRSPRRYWRLRWGEGRIMFRHWILENRLKWCREIASEIEFGLRMRGMGGRETPQDVAR
ncbi:hypothetical protein [Rubrobacter calidifluminis]|uniref:hypothetical protein n=1 Tax=Rubrobacter calidifluminis TaxID=1392640 RepID=UPI00235F8862|nr:hypothetical protein [Rubrobacter calidifluminis]